ncbi:uncharacterized protein LOC120004124 isoform X3 [Tripterygium wilfordii]|uniref:uncharacterized protein LOC120004124 isoform X3 n=1 Tax=Tripterygium wilfordii TaxID=458696 RepID=UPI0018F83AEB|nr:uncharacterized protein LOC120004124 isoform X3 [Tripterygium wilfordii]XP_038709304.1 uncharacterized protein LOC120004124 isoform X3 [Tripterygium wilfordii]
MGRMSRSDGSPIRLLFRGWDFWWSPFIHIVIEWRHSFSLTSLVSLRDGSPVTRWASVAFGAGVGLGSAYTECSRIFDGSPAKLAPPKMEDSPAKLASPEIVDSPAPQVDLSFM